MSRQHNDFDYSNENLPKVSFKRIEFALNQVINTAIPLHLKLLQDQTERIDHLQCQNPPLLSRSEEIKAKKIVQLLKTDLYELQNLNAQVRDEDSDLFFEKVRSPTRDIIDSLSSFMELHSDILQPFSEIDCNAVKIPPLYCDLEKENSIDSDDGNTFGAVQSQCLGTSTEGSGYGLRKHWVFLRKELLEINSLIKEFATLVFSQKKDIDHIQDNILQVHENVHGGTKHLKKAAILQATTFPLTGALIGGLLLGPVGALAGFKLMGGIACAAGSVACAAGGSVFGYKVGRKLKQQRQLSCDLEMKSLTYSSRCHSNSNPELNRVKNMDPLPKDKDA